MPSSCPRKTFFRLRMNILLVIVELHVASSKVKAGTTFNLFLLLLNFVHSCGLLHLCVRKKGLKKKKKTHTYFLSLSFGIFLGIVLIEDNWGFANWLIESWRLLSCFSSRRIVVSNYFLLKSVNMQKFLGLVFGCYLQFCIIYYFVTSVFQNTSTFCYFILYIDWDFTSIKMEQLEHGINKKQGKHLDSLIFWTSASSLAFNQHARVLGTRLENRMS